MKSLLTIGLCTVFALSAGCKNETKFEKNKPKVFTALADGNKVDTSNIIAVNFNNVLVLVVRNGDNFKIRNVLVYGQSTKVFATKGTHNEEWLPVSYEWTGVEGEIDEHGLFNSARAKIDVDGYTTTCTMYTSVGNAETGMIVSCDK